MEKTYTVTFGNDPRTNTGLTPTFIIFQTVGGTALLPPPVSEVGSGFYAFTYGITTFGYTIQIQFQIDGGSGLDDGDRYVVGALDSLSMVDRIAGFLADSFGTTAIDPSSLVGYAKRAMEWLEGNANYNKSSTVWSVYSRGSSTLLREKTLSNTATEAEKT